MCAVSFVAGSLGGCGKTPAAVNGGAPASASSQAPAPVLASAAVAPPASAVATTSPKRPAGCWSSVSEKDPKARLEALAVRCAKGFRALLASTPVKAGVGVDVILPPNTCARIVLVGTQASARLERADGTVFARAQGDADAVLPEGGPFCTAKGETVKLVPATDGEAAVFASP